MVQQLFPSALNAPLEAIRVAWFQLVTSKCLAVTAEAAGSSPVVPAIPFNSLRLENGNSFWFCVVVCVATRRFDPYRERI